MAVGFAFKQLTFEWEMSAYSQLISITDDRYEALRFRQISRKSLSVLLWLLPAQASPSDTYAALPLNSDQSQL